MYGWGRQDISLDIFCKLNTSLQLFGKIKIQTRVLYCIIKVFNKNYTKRDEFVSTAYYT